MARIVGQGEEEDEEDWQDGDEDFAVHDVIAEEPEHGEGGERGREVDVGTTGGGRPSRRCCMTVGLASPMLVGRGEKEAKEERRRS